jgi:hypothetical protein
MDQPTEVEQPCAEAASTNPAAPWYESNLIWVPLAFAASIVLGLILTVQHDLRWLLWVAWALTAVSVWMFARRTRELVLVAILGTVLTGFCFLGLNSWLGSTYLFLAAKPPSPVTTVPANDAQTQQPEVMPRPQISHHVQQPRSVPVVPPSGKGANETVIPPGTHIEQKSTGPCSPNIVGSGNTASCTQINQAPPDRHLTDDQKTALQDKSISDACVPSKVDIWWEPTPEAASYGNDFVKALGASVGIRTHLDPVGEGYKGVWLSRTLIDNGAGQQAWIPNPCGEALELSFKVIGLQHTQGGLHQKTRAIAIPPKPNLQPPQPDQNNPTNGQPFFTRRRSPPPVTQYTYESAPPETVIFVGTPE